eukprot:4734002-Karenia_brevis.AAC.1
MHPRGSTHKEKVDGATHREKVDGTNKEDPGDRRTKEKGGQEKASNPSIINNTGIHNGDTYKT